MIPTSTRSLERSLLRGCCTVLLLCCLTRNVLAKKELDHSKSSKALPRADESSAEVPSPSENIAGSPALSAAARTADFKAMIKAARDLGMPRLEAYLKDISGFDNESSFPEAKHASAPKALTKSSERQHKDPVPVSDSLYDEDTFPSFYGKPLIRTEADKMMYARQQEDIERAKAEGNPAPLVFPIIYLDQLYNLDDKQAGEIFHLGTAEIPSKITKSALSSFLILGSPVNNVRYPRPSILPMNIYVQLATHIV